jgi:hypothetical protein
MASKKEINTKCKLLGNLMLYLGTTSLKASTRKRIIDEAQQLLDVIKGDLELRILLGNINMREDKKKENIRLVA